MKELPLVTLQFDWRISWCNVLRWVYIPDISTVAPISSSCSYIGDSLVCRHKRTTMNKAILFIAIPCVIALVLVNVQGQYYGGGYGYGAGVNNDYNQYYQSYAKALAQKRSLNRLSQSANLARYINFSKSNSKIFLKTNYFCSNLIEIKSLPRSPFLIYEW